MSCSTSPIFEISGYKINQKYDSRDFEGKNLYPFNMKYWGFKMELKFAETDCNCYLYFYVKCLEVLPCFCPALKYHGYRKEADIK